MAWSTFNGDFQLMQAKNWIHCHPSTTNINSKIPPAKHEPAHERAHDEHARQHEGR